MANRDRSTQALRERAAQLLARANDLKQAAATAERSALTHRKIVLGAWVLHEFGSDLARLPAEAKTRLNAFARRPHDRRVLNLPTESATEPNAEQPATMP